MSEWSGKMFGGDLEWARDTTDLLDKTSWTSKKF